MSVLHIVCDKCFCIVVSPCFLILGKTQQKQWSEQWCGNCAYPLSSGHFSVMEVVMTSGWFPWSDSTTNAMPEITRKSYTLLGLAWKHDL